MAYRRKPLYRRVQIEQKAKDVRLTKTQMDAVVKWACLLKSGELRKESENYTNFQRYIMEDLLEYENVKHERDNVDFVVLSENGDGHALVVECKDSGTGLDQKQHRKNEAHRTPMSQLWDYMTNAKWGIVTNYRQFRLVKRSRGSNHVHEIDFLTLYDEDGPDRSRIAEFVYTFGEVVQTGDDALDTDVDMEDMEMTNRFYRLFRDTRTMMVKEFELGGVDASDAVHKAQTFLNRLIFLFFVEDQDMVKNGLFMRQLRGNLEQGFPDAGTDVICRGIRDDLFRVLDKGYARHRIPKFNGGLFREVAVSDVSFRDYRDAEWFGDVVSDPAPISSYRAKKIAKENPHLSPIILNIVEMRQHSFLSDIDVNILGHVFEQSVQDMDDAESASARKNEGMYYTPSYITDYICRNTILPYLSLSGELQAPETIAREYAERGRLVELDKKLRDLRILDPACGSGAFITGAAAVLLEVHEAVHNIRVWSGDYLTTSGQYSLYEWSADTTMRNIISDNIYGVDKNPQAVKIAQLSLFLLVADPNNPLPDTSGHIIPGNSIVCDDTVDPGAVKWEEAFPEVFTSDNPGFDVIVGNPPYGARLAAAEKAHLKKAYGIGGTNTAAIFVHQSLRLLKRNGAHGFIVPKSLMFSSREWTKTREALLPDMALLVDVGKVWRSVKLEQCIYVVRSGSATPTYVSGVRAGDIINTAAPVDKGLVSRFGAFPSVSSETEIRLGNKLANYSSFLASYTDNTRGATIRSSLLGDAGAPVIGGKQVQPYRISGVKGYVNPAVAGERARVKAGAVLAQNIVAHIQNPADHIRITATVPDRSDFLILDTVNQLNACNVSPYFVLGLLHSKVVNWYAYRFIFSKSVRTMHLDKTVTDRIPIAIYREDEVVARVRAMLACYSESAGGDGGPVRVAVENMSADLDRVFYDIFGLTAEEVRLVEESFGIGKQAERVD